MCCWQEVVLPCQHELHKSSPVLTRSAYGFNAYFGFGKTEFSWMRGGNDAQGCSKERLDGAVQKESIDGMWDNHPNSVLLSLVNKTQHLIKERHEVSASFNCALLFRSPPLNDWIISCASEKITRVSADNSSSLSKDLAGVYAWLRSVHQDPTKAKSSQGLFHSRIDPRLIGTSNQQFFASGNIHEQNSGGRIAVTLGLLKTNMSDSTISIENEVHFHNKHGHDEKNWTPFELRGELYFLTTIWPFNAVRPNIASGGVHEIDTESCFRWPWSRGLDPSSKSYRLLVLRGGTQAVAIGNDTFLAFFHSYNNVTDRDSGVLKTYTPSPPRPGPWTDYQVGCRYLRD